MKYQLFNCEIELLSDNIYETTPKENIVVDQKCLGECWKCWDEQREEPFRLLINCKNCFSFSFEGAKGIGEHPLQQKTAIFCDKNDYQSRGNVRFMLQVKKMTGHFWNHKVFNLKTYFRSITIS
jgi:hypothetical protein